ncbi:microtubule-associated protein futsch-like isoform X2 [Oncorhynchus masou masou]|uniref:microtubule-associated protein futsch-like isoform X2 n=1 Tax=Oncorhynchus masou masou TaxID=90313 RepID=UPI003183DC0A
MPAPKRHKSFQAPQAKRRKEDQNEVAMPSNKTTPASATSSNPQREAPLRRRNKKKPPAELKEGNKPAGSSRHSSKTKSTQKARTRTKFNPPVKNAKLLKATSASSKNPNSKGTLKRPAMIFKTASTESDEELIRTHKPHCIRKYSNGDRGKRKGSQSNLNEEVLLSDPVQRDHNYGIPSASYGSHSEIEENKRKRVRESTRGPETKRDVNMESQMSSEPLPEQSGQMKQSSETHEVQDNSITTPTDEFSESVNTKPDIKMSPPASPEKASDPIPKQVNQNNSMTTPTDEFSESVNTKPDIRMSPPASPDKASDPIHKQVNQNNSMTTPTDEFSESVNTKPDIKISPPASPEKASDPIHKQVNQSREKHEEQNDSVTIPTYQVSESVASKMDAYKKSADPIPELLKQSTETQDMQENSMTTHTAKGNEQTKVGAKILSPPAIGLVAYSSSSDSECESEGNDRTGLTESIDVKMKTQASSEKASDPVPEQVKESSETMQKDPMTTSTYEVTEESMTTPTYEVTKDSMTTPTYEVTEDSMTSPTYEVTEDSMTSPTESVDAKLDANIKPPPSIEVYSEEASDPVPKQVHPEQVNQIYIEIEKVQEDFITTPTDEVCELLDSTLDAEIMSLPPLEASSEETHTFEVSESVETKCSELAPEHVTQSTEMQGDSAPTHADQVSESVDTKLDIEVNSAPPVELSSEETSDIVSVSEQVLQSSETQEVQGDSMTTRTDELRDTKLDIEVNSAPPVELSSDETSDIVSVSEQVLQSSETQEVQGDSMTTRTDELRESLGTKSGAKIKSPPLEVLFSALKESSLCKHPLSHTMRSNVKEFLGVEDSLEITKKDCDFGVTESIECTLDLETPIIVEDMEIGHCVVEVVGENGDEVDSDLEIIDNSDRPEKTLELTKVSEEECSVDKSEDGIEKKGTSSSNQESTNSGKKEATKKTQGSLEKPKKQQMNPQARTKARLAALAEQKAAASKKASRQLNLLALCEEIADDIATDTMLIKTKEEEEQVVTITAEPSKEPECTPPVTQPETVPIPPTPARPEEPSPAVEPSAEEPAPAKPPAPEPPQRRFFISQVTVPLKIHEKKKLTRFQRLRQVELQREKNMSWTMVKKLKSDQKMIPETETKPSPPAAAPVQVTTPPPPSASPAAPTVAALSPTSQEVTPKVEPPKVEPPKVEPPKIEPPKVTPSKGPTLRKRTLPAEPPPMPNGLKAQKAKPVVEYKPYKSRPKYSFDDFECDDEPKPTVQKAAVRPTATTIQRAAVKPTAVQRAAVRPTPSTIQRAAGRTTPTTIQRAAGRPTPTTIQREAGRPTPTTIQREAGRPTPTTIQRKAGRPTPVSENGKHEDSKPTVQKPENRGQKTVGPTVPKTGHITQKTVGPTTQNKVPTVQKAVEIPAPMSKNGKHEDCKLTVQNAVVPTVRKADIPRPSVQKAVVVPISSPKTEQKAEAPPTAKTGEDEDSIAPVSSLPSEEPPRDSVDKEQCEEMPAVTEIKPASPEDKTTTENAVDSKKSRN